MSSKEFSINNNVQTVTGDLPRVGIRNAIDGRERGVKEPLEGYKWKGCCIYFKHSYNR